MDSGDDSLAHAVVGSWFLGPRAENAEILNEFFSLILTEQQAARESLYPDDPAFITAEMMQTAGFQESIDGLRKDVKCLSENLATHSIPFWSPRYNAHMNMDTAMPSIIGYMAAMMYNPNNVATEASPFTTGIEKEVGMRLCRMVGYGGPLSGNVVPWGHITCDGSVANLEAIWAIRNLKFYPLSLKLAMSVNGPLAFLANVDPPFVVATCKGDKKPFNDLSTWELLNLEPSTVLDIPTRLGNEYSISGTFLQDALNKYSVQTVGPEYLEQQFGIKKSPKFFISTTKHYSWPKGGAITGLGSQNFINVGVDEDARMDTQELRSHLDACLQGNSEDDYTAVFGGVAIIGSTEHGACDPIEEVIQIRDEYQARGLSFAIHCDAAWGGYFTSTIAAPEKVKLPFVPELALKPYTKDQLRSLKSADSITIDPHKSGYINYPAGGLCYRDGRMRYLITWTSPYVFHQGDETGSMGVYGVEGSKPGASAVATWLTLETIGEIGYKRLLGEAIFTCAKLYCHWATMTGPEDDLIVVPLNRLPSETNGEDVEEEKTFIRENILGVSNEQLVSDECAFGRMVELGSDLMINAFACNFKINGVPNQDVGEANYLNERIFQRLSVTNMDDVVGERPLFLTSSSFDEEAYGRCLVDFKRRLQLGDGTMTPHGALSYLINVTMSPWPTDSPFLSELAQSFRKIAEEEVQRCILRNEIKPSLHRFVMQGLNRIYLVYMPMFHMADHRQQLIITADFPPEVQELYQYLRKKNPDKTYTIANANPELLSDLLKPGADIEYRMDEGIPDIMTQPFKLSNINVVINKSLSFDALESTYPKRMRFYLYGTEDECYIDHVLEKAPNAQISIDRIKMNLSPKLSDEQLAGGVIAVLEDVYETSIQPLPLNDDKSIKLESPGLALVAGRTHKASVYSTYGGSESKPIATGNITLQGGIFADWEGINGDPFDRPQPLKWPSQRV